jgi:hypothetical protein
LRAFRATHLFPGGVVGNLQPLSACWARDVHGVTQKKRSAEPATLIGRPSRRMQNGTVQRPLRGAASSRFCMDTRTVWRSRLTVSDEAVQTRVSLQIVNAVTIRAAGKVRSFPHVDGIFEEATRRLITQESTTPIPGRKAQRVRSKPVDQRLSTPSIHVSAFVRVGRSPALISDMRIIVSRPLSSAIMP